MRRDIANIIAIAVVSGIAVVALSGYWALLRAHLRVTYEAMRKDVLLEGQTGLARLNTKLLGWKTIILAWIAGLVQAASLLLQSDLSPFKDLPWSMVFEEKVANWITFAIAAIIPLTHAMGMAKAATTPPASND